MNKDKLCRSIAAETGMGIADTKRVINEFLRLTGDAMIRGDSVKIPGFGTFERRHRKRYIHTGLPGEEIEVPATYYPFFSASQVLRRKVKEHETPPT